MSPRRLALVAGLAALLVSAAHPAASAPIDVEGAAYGGAASGGWACGPDARAKYGGIGGSVTVRPTQIARAARAGSDAGTPESRASEPDDPALVLSFASAAEHRAFTLVDCSPSSSCNGVPPPGVALASSFELGGDWHTFGIRVGALGWQSWGSATDRGPTWNAIPELKLRFGYLEEGFRFELGFGSYGETTLLRPGAWGGLVVVPSSGWEVAVRAGLHVNGVGDWLGPRLDLALLIPVTRAFQVGVGGALSGGLGGSLDPEGRVMMVAHVW